MTITTCNILTTAQETLTCYDGISVTSSNGNVEYTSIKEKQCKVHNFCQTTTMQTTDAYSGESSKYLVLGKILYVNVNEENRG